MDKREREIRLCHHDKAAAVAAAPKKAAVQQVIRLEESSVKGYRSHIPFAAREAEYAF